MEAGGPGAGRGRGAGRGVVREVELRQGPLTHTRWSSSMRASTLGPALGLCRTNIDPSFRSRRAKAPRYDDAVVDAKE